MTSYSTEVLSRPLAVFDLDGTLTVKDTTIDCLVFGKTPIPVKIAAVIAYLLLKFRLINTKKFLNLIAKYCVYRLPEGQRKSVVNYWIKDRLPLLIRPGTHELLRFFLQKGFNLVLVTTSIDAIGVAVGKELGFEFVLPTRSGADGKIMKVMHGNMKKESLLEIFANPLVWEGSVGFGNEESDAAFLSLTQSSFMVSRNTNFTHLFADIANGI